MKVRSSWAWVLLFAMCIVLIFAAVIMPLQFHSLAGSLLLFIPVILLIICFIYSVIVGVDYITTKLDGVNRHTIPFMRVMIGFGIVLIISTILVYGLLAKWDSIAEKKFTTDSRAAYEFVNRIESYKDIRGYYPYHIAYILGTQYAFYQPDPNLPEYEWSDGSHHYLYEWQSNDSYYFNFDRYWYDATSKQFDYISS